MATRPHHNDEVTGPVVAFYCLLLLLLLLLVLLLLLLFYCAVSRNGQSHELKSKGVCPQVATKRERRTSRSTSTLVLTRVLSCALPHGPQLHAAAWDASRLVLASHAQSHAPSRG